MAKTNRIGTDVGQSADVSFAITPNDAADLSDYTRGILVGVAGNVTLLLMSDTGDTGRVVYLAAGVIHPLAVRKVFATGTAATGIVGFH